MERGRGMTTVASRKLFCFGMGYTAQALARQLGGSAVVVGTSRTPGGEASCVAFDGMRPSEDVVRALQGVTHVLLSIPPSMAGDPVLIHHGADLARLGTLKWIGYLSTVGVYGDARGEWVDEESAVKPLSERGRRRADAEEEWRHFGRARGVCVQVFRLPGIYGPGRSAVDSVRQGTARRIIKAGQVFNRIHVDDIASALELAIVRSETGAACAFDTFNVVDDEPAPPQDVIAYAAALLGVPSPPDVPIEAANLSEMGASFYRESKRVRNLRLKATLGWVPAYPTYREGLGDIAAQA